MKSLLYLLSAFILVSLSMMSTSCQKETDCKATVKCVDTLGNAVSGATVLVFAQVKDPNDPNGTITYTADVKASGTTDGGGQVNFVFKLPAIFDVRATKEAGSILLEGNSILKLEAGETVSKTVTLGRK